MAPQERQVRCYCRECRGKVHLQKTCRRKDSPHPDDASGIDITGRYEEDQRLPQFTCQINQAGIHIEGWLQFVYVAAPGKELSKEMRSPNLPRQIYTFSGTLLDKSSGQYDLVFYDDWTRNKGQEVGRGALRKGNKGRLAFTASITHSNTSIAFNLQTSLRPYPVGDKTPRLSELALSGLPAAIQQYIAPLETAPLPAPYIKQLHQTFSPVRIREIIRLWRTHEGEPNTECSRARRELIKPFNDYVGRFLNRFHSSIVPVLRWHVRNYLSRFIFEEGASRSLLQDLEIAVTRTPQYKENEFPFLGKDNLDLVRTDLGETEHHYEAELLLSGGTKTFRRPVRGNTPTVWKRTPVGGGALSGTLTVKKVYPPDKTWTTKFDIQVFGLSLGASYGGTIAIRSTGSAVTYADWRPENFCGSAILIDASLWASLGGGRSYGVTVLHVHGDQTWAALDFDFSGWSTVFGIGGGISGSLFYGEISRQGAAKNIEIPSESRNFPLTSISSTEAHFELGCAVLEKEGRAAIRRMCAKELFFLSSPYSSLRIDGYTDRVDCAKRNIELSNLRSQNTLQAVQDILGKKMAEDMNIRLNYYGEEPAERAGLADGAKDRAWRKVEVFLNGRGLIRLQDSMD